ncbi:hypothetical protein HOY80DRAFT_989501 [Tuber brumale]|nr:hypothetical protein HOY80DRAFT_989501 [Tuber brumale]
MSSSMILLTILLQLAARPVICHGSHQAGQDEVSDSCTANQQRLVLNIVYELVGFERYSAIYRGQSENLPVDLRAFPRPWSRFR